MPGIQSIDLNPLARTESTSLEKTLSAFGKRNRENQVDEYESDALKDIYSQYQKDGQNLERAILDIQSRPGLSPTTRVNNVKQLMEFKKYNSELQAKAEKARMEEFNNKNIVRDLEKRRGYEEGELAAYESDPKMAEQVTREPKEGQANKPIDEDQLKRIEHIRGREDYQNASPARKYQILTSNGVSKENAKAEADVFAEDAKLSNERASVINKEQAKEDIGFVNQQIAQIPQLFAQQQVFDQAYKVNEEGATGDLWDQAMTRLGLLQFSSDGHRVFTSLAKDVIKYQNLKDIVGSQMSGMEFKFFVDATINPNFSKEANRQILRKDMAALRYKKLYADITKSVVQQNQGEIPVRVQELVNEEFAKQSPKIAQEVKEAAIDFEAIQNVPKGKVLMYDRKRRPLHVPANEVEKYTKPPFGATLS